jgi:quinol monooxygenase YgiN
VSRLHAEHGLQLKEAELDRVLFFGGIRLDQESVDAIVDAFDIGAHARGNHRQAEIAQFGQHVAERLCDSRHQHGCIRAQPGQQLGQLIALVIEYDMHAPLAEEGMRIGACAKQEDIGVFAQPRQHLLEQLRTLAATHAARNDQAQAVTCWRIAAMRAGIGPA